MCKGGNLIFLNLKVSHLTVYTDVVFFLICVYVNFKSLLISKMLSVYKRENTWYIKSLFYNIASVKSFKLETEY